MPSDETRSVSERSVGGRRGDAAREPTAEQLLRRYRKTRAVAVRNVLIERHRSVVEAMARAMAARVPRSVDPQDLVHAGMWGLMQAIDKYDPQRCDQFLAFLRIRVRGAMLDELRHLDWLPRLWRRRQRDREAATGRLRLVLAREPSDSELASELGISVRKLQTAWARSLALQPATLPAMAEDSTADAMDGLADATSEPPIEAISRQELLAKIRSALQPVEWKVLQMHYLEGMSGKEVARRLRLSASRICQIHGRVLDRLKSRLAVAAV